MIKCVLFDRDGTLGWLDDVRFPTPFHPFAPIAETFAKIKALGVKVGIISNQSSIARGTAGNYDFAAEFRSYGADIWEICPHDTTDGCNCRKPKSGMLLSAAARLGLPTRDILVVGDRLSDILCAENAGSEGVLVLTGKGKDERMAVLGLFPRVTVLPRFDDVPALLEARKGKN